MAAAAGGRPVIGVLFVFVGAGAGGVLRYLVTQAVDTLLTPRFPTGTIVVNVTGCFLIGLLAPVVAGPNVAREELRLLLFVGLLGGFTTFSTFGRETIALLQDGRPLWAGTYFAASNGLGLLAAWAGIRAGARLFGA